MHNQLVVTKDEQATSPYRDGDLIVAINNYKVRNHWDIAPIARKLSGDDVTVTVLRTSEDGGTAEVEIGPIRPLPVLGASLVFLADGTVLRGVPIGKSDDDKDVTIRLTRRPGVIGWSNAWRQSKKGCLKK